ncbi:MAG: hypothetical protein RLZZ384_1154 [Pseudomonadota bacterium]
MDSKVFLTRVESNEESSAGVPLVTGRKYTLRNLNLIQQFLLFYLIIIFNFILYQLVIIGEYALIHVIKIN